MFKRTLVLVAATLLATSAFAGTKGKGNGAPQRLMAVTVNGQLTTLKLGDGTSVEVPSGAIRIAPSQGGDVASDADEARGMQKNRMTLDQLAAMKADNGLPAVVMIRYDKNGLIKRAKVRVFPSSGETNAFLAGVARAAKSKNH